MIVDGHNPTMVIGSNVIAPGNDIFSLMPWDKPFYLNYETGFGINTRFDYLDGTSMSAAFVSAAAARRMGYKPTETGEQVGADVVGLGRAVDASCSWFSSAWPGENLGYETGKCCHVAWIVLPLKLVLSMLRLELPFIMPRFLLMAVESCMALQLCQQRH